MTDNTSFPERFSDDPSENFRIENEFLKLKIQAQLSGGGGGIGNVTCEEEIKFLKNVPAFEDAEMEGVIEITEQSMEPTFENGSRIAITGLKDPQMLIWGECYFIIDKTGNGLLRRIYPGETLHLIELVCDNLDQIKYPPIMREWHLIKAICKVKAEIRY